MKAPGSASFPLNACAMPSLLLSPQNYSCPSVMVLAVPVAVRFLQSGNRELSRNMSSYLSLAAIAKADLLAEHTEAIALSVLGGRTRRHMSTWRGHTRKLTCTQEGVCLLLAL